MPFSLTIRPTGFIGSWRGYRKSPLPANFGRSVAQFVLLPRVGRTSRTRCPASLGRRGELCPSDRFGPAGESVGEACGVKVGRGRQGPCRRAGHGESKPNGTAAPAGHEPAGRVGFVRPRSGGRLRPPGRGCSGPGAGQPLVPGRSMGPGLGHRLRLGLESLPRLARSAESGRLGPLGTPAGVGAAAAAPAAVGARGSADVEPDPQCLGLLEQRNLDSGLSEPAVVGGVA
jgi:hypothetical protein